MRKKKIKYVTPDASWIQRRKKGDGFIYVNDRNKSVRKSEVVRITQLGIPPAYEEVRICPLNYGHIQAVGRDSKRRKQYIYHPDWVAMQAATKFQRLFNFGKALPQIRAQVDQDLRAQKMTKQKILAAMVKIMDLTNIRVGNIAYAKDHQTYGLTTLRKKHTRFVKNRVLFRFKGKNETPWELTLAHPSVCKIIKRCAEIPGHVLFKYEDEAGQPHPICSEDFNAYLAAASQKEFTAKDFRTWAACRELFQHLVAGKKVPREEQAAYLKEAIKEVAQKMGHTVAICRKSYLHPHLMKSFEKGTFQIWLAHKNQHDIEKLLLKWWKDHIKTARVKRA
ncbi:MAG: DNA topoisomerase IB [Holosporaceae bacterium]|nr:MAG: DNA topoisomerase IB [Holosporaceae bacterium]